MSIFPNKALGPNCCTNWIASSNDKYETEHESGSMKSFTPLPSGAERLQIQRQPPCFFGTAPIGLQRKFDIGGVSKGPMILPI